MKFSIFLFLFTEFIVIAFANLAQQRKLCSNRCHRLLKRSLERIERADTVEDILYRIIAFRRQQMLASVAKGDDASSSADFDELPEPFRNICWKFFDFEDCSNQCEKAFFRRRKRKNAKKAATATDAFGRLQRMAMQFCQQNDFAGVPYTHFGCIHKFHAFAEIRCSAYQQKAVELRLMALQLRSVDDAQQQNDFDDKQQQHANAIDQEVCLLLHQHSTCLGNALGRHCPFARALFTNRHALRDNFLSFVLPFGTVFERRKGVDEQNANIDQHKEGVANLGDSAIALDQLFSEPMLDMCQLLNFNGMAAQWQEQREEASPDSPNSLQDEQQKQMNRKHLRWTTKRSVGGTLPEAATTEMAVPSGTPQHRRVFSSDEDLLDIPPNFQYSSARLPPDFYTRYAIWWGGRSPVKSTNQRTPPHSTVVRLLPAATTTQMPAALSYDRRQWPHTTVAESIRETVPDVMPTVTHWPLAHETILPDQPEEDIRRLVSLPYLVNGAVTVPRQQWHNTEGTTPANAQRRTEIQLLQNNDEDIRRRTTSGSSNAGPSTTTTAHHTTGTTTGNDRAAQKMPATAQTNSLDTTRLSDGFRVHKLPNDVHDKQQHLDHGMVKSEDSSTEQNAPVEQQIVQQLNKDDDDEQQQNHNPFDHQIMAKSTASMRQGNGTKTTTQFPPLLRGDANNVYFVKILDFGEENNGQTADKNAGTAAAEEAAQSGRVTAYMEHFPREQLKPAKQRISAADQSLEADHEEDNTSSDEEDYFGDDQNDEDDEHYDADAYGSEGRHVSYKASTVSPGPKRLPTARSNGGPGLADLSSKSRVPFGAQHHRPTSDKNGTPSSRIVVTAEPLPPGGHSDVLLVLLGLYGTFFGAAAFLLLCLLLACLERRRRRRGASPLWGGRYRRNKYSLNAANAKKGGSAILYLDERLGTVKCRP